MAPRRATIEDVARAAGVSVATVSRALRNMPNVAAATKARVAKVAAGLGYIAHPAAASLASGRTSKIGLAAPFYGIWYTGKVTVGVLSVLSDAGYDLEVLAVDTPQHRAEFIDRVPSLAVAIDGLLLVDFYGDEHLDQLHNVDMAVVCLGERQGAHPSVSIDNVAAARRATDHLIGLGHRRIGLLGAGAIETNGSPVLLDRRAGFEAAMREAGLEIVKDYQPDAPLNVQGGADAVGRLAYLDEPPTALFALSDETAMGAIGRARELGVVVPEDMSVIGFDGHELAEPFGLTTMRQPVQELGERIATRMLDILTAPAERSRPTDHIEIAVELVTRTSCTRPRPETL